MKYKSFVATMTVILAAMFAAGCTSAPVEETSDSSVPATEPQATSDSNAPVTEPQASDRYVEINLLDGTKVGGQYVSETAAFTTIIVMYKIDPDAYVHYNTPGYVKSGSYSMGPTVRVKNPDEYLVKGTGDEVSIKNSLINTMVTIDDPTSMIESTLQEMNDNAVAMEKAAKDIAAGYQRAAESRKK